MKHAALRRQIFALAGFITFVGAFLLFAQPAHAATITVTNSLDSGAGSLRQAVRNAAAGDRIVFSPAGFNHAVTITLNSQIEISKSLLIDGAAGNVVTPTLSGGDITRTLQINRGVNITLKRLRITNGRCTGCPGGGIYNQGALSLTLSTLVSNTATVGANIGSGGGIYNDTNASLDVSGCALISNTAIGGYGGAIYNAISATLNISNSSLAGNSAVWVNGNGGLGGAIHNEGSLRLVNSNVIGNKADNVYGGGITNYDGLAEVKNSTFTGNSTYQGGGIYSRAPLTVTDSVFNLNTAAYGGGISNRDTLNLNNTNFISNTADRTYSFTGDGGGILNAGTLQVTSSRFVGNNGQRGAAIYNESTLNVVSSTLTGNFASLSGGGIFNSYLYSYAASLYIANSTLNANSAGSMGGGIANTDRLMISNTTFSGNTAVQWGGGVAHYGYNVNGTVVCHAFSATNATFAADNAPHGSEISSSCPATLTNTLIAGSCDSSDFPITDGGYNLESGNSCGFSTTLHSQIDTAPMLGPFGSYGGPAQTFALAQGSPAIDAADDTACPLTDERGVARPVGAHCDIGAFEYNDPHAIKRLYMPISQFVETPSRLVTNTNDSGPGSLRQAVRNATPNEVIGFAPAVFSTPQTITLSSGQITISTSLSINGAFGDIAMPTLDGNSTSRIFQIAAGAKVTLNHLRIVHGMNDWNSPNGMNGAGIDNYGSLKVINSVLSDNSTLWDGGAINNRANLRLENVTLFHNSANVGAGVFNDYNSALSVVNGTFVANTATYYSGAIANSTGASALITNSTIVSNTSYIGSSIESPGDATFTLWNTIISNYCNGLITDAGHNLDIGANCHLTHPTSLSNTNPLLGSLGYYSSTLPTLPLLVSSPAIDAGDDKACPATDARGVQRPVGAHCDIGAYEYDELPIVTR
jgi:hypothetical protein